MSGSSLFRHALLMLLILILFIPPVSLQGAGDISIAPITGQISTTTAQRVSPLSPLSSSNPPPLPIIPTASPGTRNTISGIYNGAVNYDDVLLIVNDASDISKQIGTYFARMRGIPDDNICNVTTTTSEEIGRLGFDHLRSAIEGHITSKALNGTLNYIVTTKGVPLRIYDADPQRVACVDSELTMILSSRAGEIGLSGYTPNPYYNREEPFQRSKTDMFLVTRLTAYSFEHVKVLIDNATDSHGHNGTFVLDIDPYRDGGGYKIANDWLRNAHTVLQQKGHDSFLDETGVYITGKTDVMGYCSWGSNDVNHSLYTVHAEPDNGWLPGSIAETYVSTSARSFNWGPYGQSLIADIIEEGVTGVKGYVYEPYLDACAHPDILFDRYTSGYNLAESFYMASTKIGWMDVVVGDPKIAPYMGPIELPDLEVTSADVVVGTEDAKGVPVDEMVDITVNVTVTGPMSPRYVSVTVTHTPPGGGPTVLDEWVEVPSFTGSGSTDRFMFTTQWDTTGLLGSHTIDVDVDIDDRIPETDEGNNHVSKTLDMIVPPGLDLMTLELTEVTRGETLDITMAPSGGSTDPSGWGVQVEWSANGRGQGALWNPFEIEDTEFDIGDIRIRVKVEDIPLGNLDIRGRLVDDLGVCSNWESSDLLVLNAHPLVTKLELSKDSILRTQQCVVNLAGSDPDSNTSLVGTVELSHDGSNWEELDLNIVTEGIWSGNITTLSTSPTGRYSVKASVKDHDGGQSPWNYLNDSLEVLNNPPVVNNITLEAQYVERTDSILILADVDDLETSGRYLEVYVQVWGGTGWSAEEDMYLEDCCFVWEFSPGAERPLGPVDVRVAVVDSDGDGSGWSYLNDTLTVKNMLPRVSGMNFDRSKVFRTQPLEITIFGYDEEDGLTGVTCQIEYSLNGGDWSPCGDLITAPDPASGDFVSTFTPPGNFDPGDVAFRAALTDKDGGIGGWFVSTETVLVDNSPPEVTDITYTWEDDVSTIWIIVSDLEDDGNGTGLEAEAFLAAEGDADKLDVALKWGEDDGRKGFFGELDTGDFEDEKVRTFKVNIIDADGGESGWEQFEISRVGGGSGPPAMTDDDDDPLDDALDDEGDDDGNDDSADDTSDDEPTRGNGGSGSNASLIILGSGIAVVVLVLLFLLFIRPRTGGERPPGRDESQLPRQGADLSGLPAAGGEPPVPPVPPGGLAPPPGDG